MDQARLYAIGSRNVEKAQAFAQEGSNLVITGRTESRLIAAKEKLEAEYGVEVLPIVAGGADEDAVKKVVAKAVDKFGKITTLVNNAQVSKSGLSLVDHTREDFDLAIYSGLYATFFYMKECYEWLFEHCLTDSARTVAPKFTISNQTLRTAYRDLSSRKQIGLIKH
mgnify:CR=1 FL=1